MQCIIPPQQYQEEAPQQGHENQVPHPQPQDRQQARHNDRMEDEDHHQHGNNRYRDRNEEETFGKIKFTMPKFTGSNDPEEYLSWALKVDKIFRMHNYSNEKMAMASLEFDDCANLWWEQV